VASSAVVPSLPSAAGAPSRSRLRHCGRGALGCDECLGVLALCLVKELNFDPREAMEMSPAWYLAQLEGDRSDMAAALELQHLTAQLSVGLERMLEAEAQEAAAPVALDLAAAEEEEPRDLLLWLAGHPLRFAAAWLVGLLLLLGAVAVRAWRG